MHRDQRYGYRLVFDETLLFGLGAIVQAGCGLATTGRGTTSEHFSGSESIAKRW